jgi:hypothetical protein
MKPMVWRNAIRDSDLDRTAKLVAYTISTYMNGAGEAFPGKGTIAVGAGLGKGRRAVDHAIDRIEAAGFLEVERSKGRRSFHYRATRPNVAGAAPFNVADDATLEGALNVASHDAQLRTDERPTSQRVQPNVARAATEVEVKASESTTKADERPETARPCDECKEQDAVAPYGELVLCLRCVGRRLAAGVKSL